MKWYIAAQFAAMQAERKLQQMLRKENGEANIIAIIIILVIVIALAIAFRKQIAGLFNSIWEAINGKKDDITSMGGFDTP
jgi:hypothetical protein